jgi:hypothetical protein
VPSTKPCVAVQKVVHFVSFGSDVHMHVVLVLPYAEISLFSWVCSTNYYHYYGYKLETTTTMVMELNVLSPGLYIKGELYTTY